MNAKNTAKAQLTFERREVKYLLNARHREALLRAMAPHMVPDEHGPATIRSVYFDTPTLLLARRSAEHPRYKEKIRLRSYGEPTPGSPVFLELKKKCKGVVYKRRCVMNLERAKLMAAGALEPRSQIERELAYAIGRYEGLSPAVYLAYDREAFYAANNRDFRMTFDVRVRMRWEKPALEGPDMATQILPEGVSILEVKTSKAMPLWLVGALEELGVRQAHWSKYATACRLRADATRRASLERLPHTQATPTQSHSSRPQPHPRAEAVPRISAQVTTTPRNLSARIPTLA